MRLLIVSFVILAVGLAACGRRGALEPEDEKKPDSFVLDPLIKSKSKTY